MFFIKRIIGFLLLIVLLGVLIFNIRLYYQPRYKSVGNQKINKGLIHQLAHLKGALHSGAADEMQRVYPEGFIFLNALYGLSWIELSAFLSEEEDLYKEAITEVNWVLSELSSKKAKTIFNDQAKPKYGIFYRGWSNYLLARKLKLLAPAKWDSVEVNLFHSNCAAIIDALNDYSSPFLESYPQSCWPADMTVGMTSVAIHENLFPGEYKEIITQWLEDVESKTDSLGLIPHSSHWGTGNVRESSRGSSQSLILNFLIEIDEAYAREKFKTYKAIFLDHRLGLPGIREYPNGLHGNGDIDSGPIILEIGGAASIVGQRVMALYGEADVAIGLRNCIETFGLGKSILGKKNYLFGALPIADAFIAWSNSTEAYQPDKLVGKSNWRIKVQLLSLAILILGSSVLWLLRKRS